MQGQHSHLHLGHVLKGSQVCGFVLRCCGHLVLYNFILELVFPKWSPLGKQSIPREH